MSESPANITSECLADLPRNTHLLYIMCEKRPLVPRTSDYPTSDTRQSHPLLRRASDPANMAYGENGQIDVGDLEAYLSRSLTVQLTA